MTSCWVLDKAKPLGAILVQQKALEENRHALLDALVQEHLKQHGNDPQQSLAAVSSAGSVRHELEQLADADLQMSLAHIGSAAGQDQFPTRTASVGTPTSSGTRFRILRPHAKGGLGEVFVAEDLELHREVALKEIQGRHADDQGSRGRFVLEAEITGGLEHPGIVPVYGLGAYADGRPFYAMRFIRGDSLKEAIARFHQSGDRNGEVDHESPAESLAHASGSDFGSVEFRQLLGRFIDVCNAVAYAHSRGVLHRDLKPGNVMLGKFGETLVVDWGLAKAKDSGEPGALATGEESPLRPSSGSGVAETVAGSAIGTPAFMSPEQASGKLHELGPATDVYSLGATLYTLLTNRAPISGNDIAEVLRKAQRGDAGFAEPGASTTGIPAPLVAVCRKAMSLNARDRYASPLALAEDLEHWLADEPVKAAREPLLVRTRRWMRKHPGTVSGIAAAVLVGVVGLTVGAVVLGEKNQLLSDANTQLDTANAGLKTSNQNLDTANQNLKATNEKLDLARQTADKAAAAEKRAADMEREATALAVKRLKEIEKTNELLESIFTDVNPRLEQKGGPLLIEQLTKRLLVVADKLDDKAISDPLTVARLQDFLGFTLQNLGETSKAIALHQQARQTHAKFLGPDHPNTLISMGNLASAYRDAGKMDLAVSLLLETLKLMKAKLGPEHPDTLTIMGNLAHGYQVAGKLDLGLPLYEETLKLRKAKLGPDHPDTLISMNNLAAGYRDAGKLDLALPLFEETLKLMKAKLGPDHLYTLTSMNNLAEGYHAARKLDLALPLYEETLKLRRRKLGPNHPDTLISMNNLAGGYKATGKLDLALPLYDEAVELMKAKLGHDHPDTLNCMNNLALGYRAAGKLDLALPLLVETLKLMKAKRGPEHPDTLTIMGNLALGYEAAGKLDLALPLYERTLKLMKAKLGHDHPDTLNCMNNLALAYLAGKAPAKAVSLMSEYRAVRRKQWGDSDPRYCNQLATFSHNLLKHHQYAAAEPMLRDCLKIRTKNAPDLWSTFNTRAMLGASLLGQKKLEEAEPLLKTGYEGMKAREKTIPPQGKMRLTDAAERLVQFYEATGRKDEAKKWAAIVLTLEGKVDATIHDAAKPITLKHELSAAVPAMIFQVRLKANVNYVIDMVSADPKALDPYLVLQDSARKTLAEDDDSGGYLNACIVFRAPADGIYRLRATSFNGGRGPFTLTVQESARIPAKPPAKTPAGHALFSKLDNLAETDPGYKPNLDALSAKLKADRSATKLLRDIAGNPHKVYTIRLAKGDRVVIELKSVKPRALDPVVIVADAKTILDLNDDNPELGGKSLDSRLEWTAPADGDYRIIATTMSEVIPARTGEFQLTVTKIK